MDRDAIDLGRTDVPALFRRLFIPTLLGMISISLVTVADGIFVGRGVGSDGIAAVNICYAPMMVFTGLGLMAGIGSSVVASIHLARGKIKAARLNVTQAMWLVTLATLPPVAVMLAFPETVSRWLGASERLLPLVATYMVWYVPALLFQLWAAVGLFVIRLDGAPRVAMWCSVATALSNVVLDWIFIFPLGWGIMGAASATMISTVIGGLMAMHYLLFRARTLRLCRVKWSRRSLALSLRNLGYQCRIGSSALLGEATMAVLMFTGNQVFMHYLGDAGVGAFGIVCYYTPLVFMVGNAIAQSAQPIISYNHGAAQGRRVVAARRIALRTAALCGVLVALLFAALPDYLVGLFILPADPATGLAVAGFPLFAAGLLFFILNLTAIGYFQSLGRVRPATLFALLRGLVLLVPCFVLLPRVLGVSGIWLAMPLSETLTTLSMALYLLRRRIAR